MTDNLLSQAEIDALLKNDDKKKDFTPTEKDALGEIGNISMGSAATTLSVLVSKKVSITTPKVSISNIDSIREDYPIPYVIIEVAYVDGIVGTNLLAIKETDALIIGDLMMGKDGSKPPKELNDLYLSAVTEAMNQMMGSTATSMSSVFNRKVDIAPPKVKVLDFANRNEPITNGVGSDEPIAMIHFRMVIGDLIDSEIMQILPYKVAKEMVQGLFKEAEKEAYAPPTAQTPVARPLEEKKPSPQVVARPVQFASLQPQGALSESVSNIDLILDVPLHVAVELGTAKMQIKDILDLSLGSIVQLDKLAGEPVNILVNGKLLAKGEVVVIDENFGVRITDIPGKTERLTKLQ